MLLMMKLRYLFEWASHVEQPALKDGASLGVISHLTIRLRFSKSWFCFNFPATGCCGTPAAWTHYPYSKEWEDWYFCHNAWFGVNSALLYFGVPQSSILGPLLFFSELPTIFYTLLTAAFKFFFCLLYLYLTCDKAMVLIFTENLPCPPAALISGDFALTTRNVKFILKLLVAVMR